MQGNVFAQDVVDRGPWLFYDRQTTAAGAALAVQYNFFSAQISSSKSKAQTNVLKPNSMPPPQAFSVQAIGFIFGLNMLLADVIGLLTNYFTEFKIGQKIFAEGRLDFFPGGAGLHGFASTNSTTTALISALNNGYPTPASMRRFPDYPRIIPANAYFTLNVLQGAAYTLVAAVAATAVSPAYGGLDLTGVLDGVFDREVQ